VDVVLRLTFAHPSLNLYRAKFLSSLQKQPKMGIEINRPLSGLSGFATIEVKWGG
jgi:hypothetical protein